MAARPPRRIGLAHPSIARYGSCEFADGSLLFAIQSEREWVNFCNIVLNRPDLLTDPRFLSNSARVTNRPALDVMMIPVLGAMSTLAATKRLEDARIAFGRVSTLDDLMRHTTLATTTGQAGENTSRWSQARLSPTATGGGEGRVPALGEHTSALSGEFASVATSSAR
jgi:crotonobetainyl-CoA:carnitine CoA-transferase CaiB-like acyl-CoA transferase